MRISAKTKTKRMNDITRMGVVYRQLTNGTITCGPLDQSNMLGGTGEQDRNQDHNAKRLQRIKDFYPNPKVLDYGCGNGLLVEFLRRNGIKAEGFDRYLKNSTEYLFNGDLAFSKGEYDVVTMVEVIEHTASPYLELQDIFHILKPGGILMVETSFTDSMDLDTDVYINPHIGHSTIFSHKGLDEEMLAKGFEVYGHINDNVRVYKKPKKETIPKITLITMGQGNPVALKRTLDSFKGVADEIIFGDVLIFDTDRTIIEKYQEDYNLKIIKLPFNFIFQNGFAYTLNELAGHASNDWVLYMNVAELLDGEHPIKEQINKEYNCYSLDHATETHRWVRFYNRKEVKWGGLIHEEIIGDIRLCPFNICRFKDSDKDQCIKDEMFTFYARVCNDVKELTYHRQLLRLIDEPEMRGATNQYWTDHATVAYESLKERLLLKGKRYEAFLTGNLTMYLEDIYTNPEFEKERFESSTLINFQGARKDIL